MRGICEDAAREKGAPPSRFRHAQALCFCAAEYNPNSPASACPRAQRRRSGCSGRMHFAPSASGSRHPARTLRPTIEHVAALADFDLDEYKMFEPHPDIREAKATIWERISSGFSLNSGCRNAPHNFRVSICRDRAAARISGQYAFVTEVLAPNFELLRRKLERSGQWTSPWGLLPFRSHV
jgi:hypothetical protein